jgi:CBS domain-containing protein
MSRVLDVLDEHNILCVPVTKNDVPMGFVDTLDICQFLVHMWRMSRDWATGQVDTSKLPGKFSNASAQKLINFSGHDDYRFVKEDDNLETCLKIMSQKRFQYHRFGVHNKENRLIGIISQSDIIQFAGKHLDMLPQGSKTLEDLGLLRGALTMRQDIILGDTLEALSTHGISAIALIDTDGKLIANFSASDLRGLARAVFSWFGKSTIDFLHHFGRGPKPPFVESGSTSFKQAIDKISSKERMHRLYLVDKDDRPIGVCSYTDIMPLLLQAPMESLESE